ncbi:MAG TPA: GAF domain-containing protein [Rhizomicrobium sp.]|nr:GAF domain-containing protein [Rhizomicrobium sp.]
MSGTELEKLRHLHDLRILDTEPSQNCNRIVEIAAQLFQSPIAAISLVDAERQWFKSKLGITVEETPRSWSFCSVAIEQSEPVFVVPAPEKDERFRENPFVLGAPFIRFYAGAPLIDSKGVSLGALCVIDTRDRPYPSESERACLADLAHFATQQLELESTQRALAEKQLLLAMAEHMSGVGHWRYEIKSGRVTWSEELYRWCRAVG